MRNTKSYGVVSCWQEHKMLVKAEHTYEQRNGKDKEDESTGRNQNAS
jgi:hypothetical protein